MKILLAILFALVSMPVFATQITLTQPQVDAVLADNPPPDCPPPIIIIPPDPPLPPEDCNVTLQGDVTGWYTAFRTSWPKPSSGQKMLSVKERGYRSIKFKTGSVVDSGAYSSFEAAGTKGSRFMALSDTEGCFDVTKECMARGRTTGIGWSTTGIPGGCQLKPNTTYYWNMTFTDGSNPASSSCVGSLCRAWFWVINND